MRACERCGTPLLAVELGFTDAKPDGDALEPLDFMAAQTVRAAAMPDHAPFICDALARELPPPAPVQAPNPSGTLSFADRLAIWKPATHPRPWKS